MNTRNIVESIYFSLLFLFFYYERHAAKFEHLHDRAFFYLRSVRAARLPVEAARAHPSALRDVVDFSDDRGFRADEHIGVRRRVADAQHALEERARKYKSAAALAAMNTAICMLNDAPSHAGTIVTSAPIANHTEKSPAVEASTDAGRYCDDQPEYDGV